VGLLALIVALAISTFAAYLRYITRGRESVASLDTFERYLPYAAGLGMATEWAKFFQKQANVLLPEWFMAYNQRLRITDSGPPIAHGQLYYQ
jgi:hypothetical protein